MSNFCQWGNGIIQKAYVPYKMASMYPSSELSGISYTVPHKPGKEAVG